MRRFARNRAGQTRNNGVVLPPIDVTSSRLGTGIVGTSTSIITSEEIARAPEMTLQDILSREAGIQTVSLFGGVNGTASTVDMRGFGVTSPSNVLVLINGRRINDFDLAGVDFGHPSQQHRANRNHARQQRRSALRRRRDRRRDQHRDQERHWPGDECAH